MKKNLLRRFFATVLLLAISSLTWAYDFVVDGIYYNINSDKISVTVTYETTSYNSYSGSVTIPSQVTYNNNTYDVTSIGSYAFQNCSGLTSITIPNSVTSIGWNAFSGCSGLTKAEFASIESLCKIKFGNYYTNPLYYAHHLYIDGQEVTDVVIPNSVTSIGESAFAYCSGLTSVTIPNSVTSIGYQAFYNCSGLTSVIIPNSVTSIGEGAFYGCSGLTSVTIPNSVTSIGKDAFYNCSGLTKAEFASIESLCKIDFPYESSNPLSRAHHLYIDGQEVTDIVIPQSVTSIGKYAFSGCSGLTSVTFSSNIASIGKYAFQGCSALSTLTIPETITSIGTGAFKDCSGLKSVTINSNAIVSASYSNTNSLANTFGTQVEEYILGNGVTQIGHWAFRGCSGMTSINIPNGVTSIGDSAFRGCNGMTSFTLPNSLTIIWKNAFYECKGLISIKIPDSVTSIGQGAFAECRKLTSVTLSASITSIEPSVFGNCKSLTSITIPNGVTTIGVSAFSGCSSLASVTIPNSVTSIGGGAFGSCGMTSITIPNSVTSIGQDAFSRCSSLTSITIPNSVTSIGMYAFLRCTGLTSITIPNSITSIEFETFCLCSSLKSVIIPNSVISIAAEAFKDCGLTSVKIPNSVTSIGKSAFSGCVDLTSVEMSKSVTTIESSLFYYCTSLKSIVIPNSVSSIGERAFQDCWSLVSVHIPNSVKSIGHWAFSDCHSLTSVYAYHTNATKYGANTDIFYDSNVSNATLHVPDDCRNSYINTAPWNSFAEYVDDITDASLIRYRITAAANPADGGSVTGNGAYKYGATVTMTATPEEGFVFEKWTEDGTTVSTEPTYVFAVTEYRNLIANFRNCIDGIYYSFDLENKTATVSRGEREYTGRITIPESVVYRGHTYIVTGIEDNVFKNCSGVTSVSIPSGVTSIGSYAFYLCTGLKSVTCHANNIPATGSNCFNGASTGSATLYVPESSINSYKNKYPWYSFGTILPITINGDANGNGEVEIGDVTSVLTLMATPEATGYNNKAADANGNGEIEIGDVTTILTIMAKGE